MSVLVISKDGKPLMPINPGNARVLLKEGRAKVKQSNRFTIQLTYYTATTYTDPSIEGKGYQQGGNSGFEM